MNWAIFGAVVAVGFGLILGFVLISTGSMYVARRWGLGASIVFDVSTLVLAIAAILGVFMP